MSKSKTKIFVIHESDGEMDSYYEYISAVLSGPTKYKLSFLEQEFRKLVAEKKAKLPFVEWLVKSKKFKRMEHDSTCI